MFLDMTRRPSCRNTQHGTKLSSFYYSSSEKVESFAPCCVCGKDECFDVLKIFPACESFLGNGRNKLVLK